MTEGYPMATEFKCRQLCGLRMQLSRKKEQERQVQKNSSYKGQVRKEVSGRDSADADGGQRPRTTQ